MELTQLTVNYWAIVMSAIVSVALGVIWYGPLFGKQWRALRGLPEIKDGDNVLEMKNWTMPVAALGALLMGWVLDHAIIYAISDMHSGRVATALVISFFNWLGFVAPVTIGIVLWENKSWKLWFITAGYYLITLILMGLVLAAWL